jgi:hypothetical protein
MNRENLNEIYLVAYHKHPMIEQVKAIRDILDLPVFRKMVNNRHHLYLVQQMDARIRNAKYGKPPEELPGMVYGMWNNAWDQLLDDMEKEGVLS